MQIYVSNINDHDERERQHEKVVVCWIGAPRRLKVEVDRECVIHCFEAPRQKVEVDRELGRCVHIMGNAGSGKLTLPRLNAKRLRKVIDIDPYGVVFHRPNHKVACVDSDASEKILQPLKMYFVKDDLRPATKLRELLLRISRLQKQSVGLKECASFLLSTTAMQSLVRDRKHATIREILLRNLERAWEERSRDCVQECLRNLWRQVTRSSDNSCDPKTIGNRCGELRWTMQERYGFLWNRLITFSGKKAELHSSGIEVLGGTLPALEFAWTTFFNAVARYMDKRESRLFDSCSDGSGVAAWTRLLADALDIDITREDTGSLSAFLVQTTSKRRIYASRDLEPHALSMAVLHEIGHLVLDHRPANECGLAYEMMCASDASEFDHQERAADAMAVLWEHIFLGLGFLVNARRGGQSKEDSIGQELPPACRTDCNQKHETRHTGQEYVHAERRNSRIIPKSRELQTTTGRMGNLFAHAVNVTFPEPPIDVEIDIKPGSYPNAINLGSQGVIPVAILSSSDFDSTTVNRDTIELSGVNKKR